SEFARHMIKRMNTREASEQTRDSGQIVVGIFSGPTRLGIQAGFDEIEYATQAEEGHEIKARTVWCLDRKAGGALEGQFRGREQTALQALMIALRPRRGVKYTGTNEHRPFHEMDDGSEHLLKAGVW